MAGISITVELQGFERADQALADLRRRGQDLRPVMAEIGAYLVSSTVRRFEREASPAGAPWLPTHRGGRILQDTGRLRDSITYVAGDDQVEVGTNVVYARIHQLGGVIEAKNAPYLVFKTRDGFRRMKQVTIPARPYLGVSAADGEEIEQIVVDHLEEAVR